MGRRLRLWSRGGGGVRFQMVGVMRGVRSDRVGQEVEEVGMGPSLGRGRMVWRGMEVVMEAVEVDAATGGKHLVIYFAFLQVFYTLFFSSFFFSSFFFRLHINGHL